MRNPPTKHAVLSALLASLLYSSMGAGTPFPSSPVGAPPVIGAWFWDDATLEPEGYRAFLNAAAAHSPYTLLTTSLRVSKGEVTDLPVREQIGRAVRHANSLGLQVAFDLDVRLARRAFQKRYPDEMQQELVLKTLTLPTNGTATVTFEGRDLGDHMTGNALPYLCLTSRVVRVYEFARSAQGVDPDSVREIAGDNVHSITGGPRKVTVTVSASAGRSVCVIAAHTYLTPDVFAPHLLSFQREILQQYAEVPLAGAMKDEWGFPPDHSGNPAHDRFWYSPALARAYSERSGGRDFMRDALLMFAGANGRDAERQAAINRFTKLCRERNAAIENDYYRAAKATFGSNAFVGTHATWTPYPGAQEFRKNGLDWWEATRDLGQSDESTPYPCRTSLAKRWGYPLWFNQFYSPQTNDYARELWQAALSGGRLNVHPFYPRSDLSLGETQLAMMRQRFMAGMSRLRMLDFITRAPLDCPVAVVFGHACAMNWAGPSYNRVGLEIASALCADGYPADLIPSSLIGANALRFDGDGFVCLGPQRYRAVVLHQPEFGDENELAFFERAARGKSAIFMTGAWSRDSEARPLDGMTRLGGLIHHQTDETQCAAMVAKHLTDAGVPRVTGWSSRLQAWGQAGGMVHAAPPTDGCSALTDGTFLRAAGGEDPAGDPISETLTWREHNIAVDAVGVFAIRFDSDGKVAALAAGGLKHFRTDGMEITMPARADLAFIREPGGKVRGVLQGFTGSVPAALLSITPEWQRLTVPPLLPPTPP